MTILSKLLNEGKVNQIVGLSGIKYQPINKKALQCLISEVASDAINFNTGKTKKRKIKLQDIDTSLIRDMSRLFSGIRFENFCKSNSNDPELIDKESLQDFIDDWDVSNVLDMSYMFAQSIIFGQDLSKWDVSNVLDMSYIFDHSTFSGDISNWNIKNCVNFEMCINAGYTDDKTKETCIKNKIYAHPLFIDISGWLVDEFNLPQEYMALYNDCNSRKVSIIEYPIYKYETLQHIPDIIKLNNLNKYQSEITQVGVQSRINDLYKNIIDGSNTSTNSSYYIANQLIDSTTKVGSNIDAQYEDIFIKNPAVGDQCTLIIPNNNSIYNAEIIRKTTFHFVPSGNLPYELYILRTSLNPETPQILLYYFNTLKYTLDNDLLVDNYYNLISLILFDYQLTIMYTQLIKQQIDRLTEEQLNYIQNNSYRALINSDDNIAFLKIYLCLTAKERETYCERIQTLYEIIHNRTAGNSIEFKDLCFELLKDDYKLYSELTAYMSAAVETNNEIYSCIWHPSDVPFALSNIDTCVLLTELEDINELLTAINNNDNDCISDIIEYEYQANNCVIIRNLNRSLINYYSMPISLHLESGIQYDTSTIYDANLYDVNTNIRHTCKLQLSFENSINIKITEADENLIAIDTDYYVLNKNIAISPHRYDCADEIICLTRLIKFEPRNLTENSESKYMLIYLPVMNNIKELRLS